MQQSIRFSEKDRIGVIEFDLQGEKVNKLSSSVMTRLKEVIHEVKNSDVQACILISRKKNIFIAGADIEEIKNHTTAEGFEAAINQAHEILNDLEDLKIPTVAAIHGACAGGGTELVLACDYRLCSDAKSTQIGLPETKLGIIPGFGGCWRLPRLVGFQNALPIILQGKMERPKKAKRIGLVEEVVPEAILEERAFQFAKELIDKKKGKRKSYFKPKGIPNSLIEGPLSSVGFHMARKKTLAATKGHYPAQEKAIDVVQAIYGMKDRKKALAIETKGFCEVAVTDISKYLINLFFMMEAVKKQNGVDDPSVKPLDVDHLAVLGAGVMGGGVGYVAANKGITTRMKDISTDAIAIGLRAAHSLWQKALKRRRLDQFEYKQRSSHLTGGLDFAGFKQTDVIIEAIVEDMEIKKKVIAQTAAEARPDTIMATNTSSLSVTEMAEAHPHPENFLGMHFFNPVHMMPLVEVIRGPQTSDVATATIFDLAKRMGKTPVVVKDGPGFLVNRLLLPYMGEALFLLEEGMGIDVVDRFFTHKFGMPMGPFRLMDEVGLDVGMKVLKIFRESLGERIEVSDLSSRLSDTGRLGKKNSKGFYLYDDRGKQLEVDQTIYKELGLGSPTNPLDEKECIERCMFQMVNEAAATMLTDHIVATPQECDLAMIMGTGFPPFRGGLLKWADTLGSQYIVEQLDHYAGKCGRRFKPLQAMENLGKNNKGFYQ